IMVLAVGQQSTPVSAGGSTVFLRSATNLDLAASTVTLPLFKGRTPGGEKTSFIITESSDRDDARARGVNWAPKLANALGTKAVQRVTGDFDNGLKFSGTVDFSPERVVVPSSPNGFPPTTAIPGARGDANYSPLITQGNGIVLNASQVANNTGQHDSLVSLDLQRKTVTMRLLSGFYEGDPILYLRMDASIELLAAIEASTFAPNMNAAPGLASNDRATSARAAIIPVVNGPRGIDNPERQGLESALLGEGSPQNVTQEIPDNDIYSPMWDVHPVVWTDAAIAAGLRRQLRDHEEIADLVRQGVLVSGGNGPANPSLEGLRAGGFISNCPVVAIFK
ncbi:MAG: hypothetical protein LC808_43630, partial [Actinobacteria bacterium]|nr:hypothetical protein [Actinomycetota bacterium]